MRASLAILVAMVAACSDRYGAYFDVDGHDEIEHDRVEFYFGQTAGTEVPRPPDHPIGEPESGLLVRRLVEDSDVLTRSLSAGTTTYFVPPGGNNAELGDYLLVIAYAGSQPVGIAELFDFTVPTDDVVYKYELPLVPYAAENIEMWGRPTSDCIRWTRDRGASLPATIAMVRDNDVDCDAFLDRDDLAADCEPLQYCDGGGDAGCIGSVACVIEDNGCRLGTCQNKDGQRNACAPTTCTVEQACTECDLDASPRDVIECVLFANGTHIDYLVNVMPSQALCTEPYRVYLELPVGVTCQNPRIEASINFVPSAAFEFQVTMGPGTTCLLTLTPPTPGAPLDGVPHVMISIDSNGGPTPRQTFTVGLATQIEPCTGEQTVTVLPSTIGCLP